MYNCVQKFTDTHHGHEGHGNFGQFNDFFEHFFSGQDDCTAYIFNDFKKLDAQV